MKNFILEGFFIDLNEKLYEVKLNFGNINAYNVSKIFMFVLGKYAPLRPMSRRKKHLSEEPWITLSILKSIKTKNKFFRKLFKNNNSDCKAFYKKTMCE